jgi:hypothetical protein
MQRLRLILPSSSRQRIFSGEMIESKCSACGAELIPGAGFCRQCGNAAGTSEQRTAILNQPNDSSTTQRLVSRPTSPAQSSAAGPSAANGRLKVFIAGLIIVALLGLGWVARSVIKSRSRSQSGSQISRALIYPGARVILDLNEGAGSVMQLATSDPLNKVQTWYVSNLQPTKILQVTQGTIILRKDNVTATLVAENNTTNIVIKQTTP